MTHTTNLRGFALDLVDVEHCKPRPLEKNRELTRAATADFKIIERLIIGVILTTENLEEGSLEGGAFLFKTIGPVF